MHRGSFFSFTSLFIFWMVISTEMNLEHLIVGLLVALLTVWFWKAANVSLPSMLSFNELLVFGRCLVILAGSLITSNIDVAKTLLFSRPSVTPMFIELKPGIESEWGKVLLATCITFTPGTVAIDVNPETNVFTVHALTIETAAALYDWKMIDEIKKLETLVQRR